MGAFLSCPVTDIEFGQYKAKNLSAAFASMQGWRSNQEDAHLINLNFDGNGSHLFGVFDGHGSALVSNYVAKNFVSVFTSTSGYKVKNYGEALEQTFMRLDELLEQDDVIAELQAEQEKTEDEKPSAQSAIDMFRNKFKRLIEENEDDDDENENDQPTLKPNGESKANEEDSDKDDKKDQAEEDGNQKKETESESDKKSEEKLEDAKEGEEEKGKDSASDSALRERLRQLAAPLSANVDLGVDSCDYDYCGAEDEEALATENEDAVVNQMDMEAMMADTNYERKFADKLKPEKDREVPGYGCGCTANVVLISDGQIYVANAGDSRSILAGKDEVIALSSDHGPEVDGERKRIEKAGGSIIQGRVNAGLNLTRAIGDLFYKRRVDLKPDEQMIISKPDVRQFELKPEHRFLVLACDGIWNSLSNEETAKYFEGDNIDVEQQLTKLFNDILADGRAPDGLGMDNMSAIFVRLNENNSDDDLAKFAESQAEAQETKVTNSKKRKLSANDDEDEGTFEDGQDAPPAKIARE